MLFPRGGFGEDRADDWMRVTGPRRDSLRRWIAASHWCAVVYRALRKPSLGDYPYLNNPSQICAICITTPSYAILRETRRRAGKIRGHPRSPFEGEAVSAEAERSRRTQRRP